MVDTVGLIGVNRMKTSRKRNEMKSVKWLYIVIIINTIIIAVMTINKVAVVFINRAWHSNKFNNSHSYFGR